MNLKLRYFLLFVLFVTNAFSQESLKSAFLKNVKKIPMPDSGQYASVFYTVNEHPDIVATYTLQENKQMGTAVIMASRLGKGKILSFGSSDYFRGNLLNNEGVKQLLKNAIKSVTIQSGKLKAGLSKTVDSALIKFLKLNKVEAYTVDPVKIQPNTAIYFLTNDLTDTIAQNAVEKFIRNGGILIYGSPYPNIFIHRDQAKSFTNDLLKINTLLVKSGIFNAYTLMRAERKNDTLNIKDNPLTPHIKNIIGYLNDPAANKLIESSGYAYGIEPAISLTLSNNPDTSEIVRKLKSTLAISDTPVVPTIKNPVDISTLAKKASYKFSKTLFEQRYLKKDSVHFICPESRYFPGEVPLAAKRITAKFEIAVKVGSQGLLQPPLNQYFRLHSTGFYVPPGEKVMIILDPRYENQHLKVQIGIHDDDLMHMDNLVRAGFDLTRKFELTKDTTAIFSPYGGLLYIRIPDTSTLKSIPIQAIGVVKAPYFKLEQHTLNDWKEIRSQPAPWTELTTDNIILTVPTYRIKNLEDPTSLMKFWNEVMDADADLAIINRKRKHPERIIIDDQVAYGYMFTQWDKVVAPDDESCEWMLNEAILRNTGSWGHFHELGHRHQFWGLDMNEVGEVTTNLYSMYIYDQVLKKGIYNHENISSKAAVNQKIKAYLQNQPSFEKWGNDPFLALCMYIQIIEKFGWDAIKSANNIYREMDPVKYIQNPISNQQRIDLWFNTICKTTNSDLSLFFDVWKIPVSPSVKKDVKKYKPWYPEEFSSYLPK